MGVFRKLISISTAGLVDFRSDKERIARYTKQSRNELRTLVSQNSPAHASGTASAWSPEATSRSLDQAVQGLQSLIEARRFSEYKGYGGLITLTDDALLIERKGPISRVGGYVQGTRSVDIERIYSVISTDPNLSTNGHIWVVLYGDSVLDRQNQVLFTFQHRKEHAELLAIIKSVAEVNYLLMAQESDPDELWVILDEPIVEVV